MESQVIFEDKRSSNASEPEWVDFSAIPNWSAFITDSSPPGVVFIKTETRDENPVPVLGVSAEYYDDHRRRWICTTATFNKKCRPLPHLRLRMILEERP